MLCSARRKPEQVSEMNVLKILTLVGLLVVLGVLVATRDLQRREATATALNDAPPPPPPPPTSPPPPAVTNSVPEQPPVRSILCPVCKGNKFIEVEESTGTCRVCRGTGKYVTQRGSVAGICPFCNGSGKLVKKVRQECPACRGTGFATPGTASAVSPLLQANMRLCPQCQGKKVIPGAMATCPQCAGSGRMPDPAHPNQTTVCVYCRGTGKVQAVDTPCPTCKGLGMVPAPVESAAAKPPAFQPIELHTGPDTNQGPYIPYRGR